jgi:predicted O-methyltransferase YrrM
MSRSYKSRVPRPLRPVLRGAYRGAYRGVTAPADRLALRDLARAPHPDAARIAGALRALGQPLPEREQEAIDAIEQARRRLLARDDRLADGSLGRPGLYDGESTVAEAAGVSKPPRAARLLFHIVRAYGPGTVVELGTNVGISAAYLASALRANGDEGRLVTLESSSYRLRLAREVHAGLGLANVDYVQGLFTDSLGPALDRIGTVDMAFIDGHHQYEPTLAYFDAIWQHARPGALFVFDDIRWSDGMRRAWAALQADERFALTVDLGTMGLCAGPVEGVPGRHRSRRMYSVV